MSRRSKDGTPIWHDGFGDTETDGTWGPKHVDHKWQPDVGDEATERSETAHWPGRDSAWPVDREEREHGPAMVQSGPSRASEVDLLDSRSGTGPNGTPDLHVSGREYQDRVERGIGDAARTALRFAEIQASFHEPGAGTHHPSEH